MNTRFGIALVALSILCSSFCSAGQFKAANQLPLFFFDGGTIVDVNHDGLPDLISISEQGAGETVIQVALGNGDGTFGPPITSNLGALGPSPNLAFFAVAGDFNGDGQLDLLLQNVSATHILFSTLGNGDGTFQPALNMPVNHSYSSFVAADLNGDGKVDLASVNFNEFPFVLSTFVGNGDGTFQVPVDTSLSTEPTGLAVADFNNDGKADLVVTDSSQQLTAFINNGTGTFAKKGPFPTGTGSNTIPFQMSVAVADLNHDGKVDVTISDFLDGKVSVLVGNGDGTFAPFVQFSSGRKTAEIVVADVNEDGIPDLVVQNLEAEGLGVLLGNGNGTFQPLVSYGLPVGIFTGPLFAGDFNQDGHIDIADFQGIALGAGDGTFPLTAKAVTIGSGPRAIAAADFNGDGIPDFVTSNVGNSSAVPPEPGSVSIGLGKGDGTFAVSAIASDNGALGVAAGDFNKDGKMDFVLANTPANAASFFAGNGDGTFQPPVDFAVDPNPNNIAVADVNNDGNLDILVTHGTFTTHGSSTNPERYTVLLGNGDGTFQPAEFVTPSINSILPEALAVADFNGDGTLDFVPADALAGGLTPYFGDGRGGFSAVPFFGIGSNGSIVVGDFNGDAHPDIAVIDTAVPSIRTYLNNGFGSAFTPVDTSAFPSPQFLTSADFDGDGKLDVATNGTGGIFTFKGNGDGSFQTAIKYANGGSFAPLAIADINSDSAPDILAITGLDPPVVLSLLNAGATPVTLPPGFSFASSQTSATVVAGLSVPVDVNVTGAGGFNSQVSFSCVGLPALSACNFSPSSLTPTSTPAPVSLTITTTGTGVASLYHPGGVGNMGSGSKSGTLFMIGFVGLCVVLSGKGSRNRAAKGLALVSLAGVLFLASCGGGGSSTPGPTPVPTPTPSPTPSPSPTPTPVPATPAGTYLVQIRASATTSTGKTVVHTIGFTLTVK